jgi:nicotinamide-nucleotide amidase
MLGRIICISDKIMSGRTADRHVRHAATSLWAVGLGLKAITTVGNDTSAIVQAFKQALDDCAFLLVAAGPLGVTEDDFTAQAVAESLGLPLVEDPVMLTNLETLAASRGRGLSPPARRMALMPAGARAFDSICCGFHLETSAGQPVYFLPGVPEEYCRLIDQRVVPELLEHFGLGRPVIRMLRTYGLHEGEVKRRLAGLAESQAGVKLGYFPTYPEVKVLLTAHDHDQARAEEVASHLEAEALARLEGFVVVHGSGTLEQVVGEELTRQGLTLCLAESCTGGLIGHRLTSVPGSSAYLERGLVVYSNRAKQELLGVCEQTLLAHGAVSQKCAVELALGARVRSGVDLGLAVTGIAGPDGGSAEKPVGTVWFGLAGPEGLMTRHRWFYGDRAIVKVQAAETALNLLRLYLENHALLRGA